MIKYEIKTKLIVISILLGLAIIGLILRSIYSDLKEFGLNFFVEILGALITLTIINIFLEKREEKKEIPKIIAVYEDIINFLADFINFWLEIYRKSVEDEEPKNIRENIMGFFSQEFMTKIWINANLDAKMPDYHSYHNLTCWEYLSFITKKLLDKANHILDRYIMYLDPENYCLIYDIANFEFLKQIKHLNQQIMEENLKNHIPRFLLTIIMGPTDRDYGKIKDLIDLCDEMYKKILPYKNDIIHFKVLIQERLSYVKDKPLNMSKEMREAQEEDHRNYSKIEND